MRELAPPAHDDLVRLSHPVGDFELTVCTDGPFLLDGGAMYGVVPKPLWSQRTPADDQNRIELGLNCVVVRTGSATVLIETGLGNKIPAKMRPILGNHELLPRSFEAAGLRREEITHVINTHLHFDHCGWNTTAFSDGSVGPTFPNARYFVAAGELAHGRLQLDRDRVSYLAHNYDPLIASGQLMLLDPEGSGDFTAEDPRLRAEAVPYREIPVQVTREIVPGVTIEPLPGHTESMLGVHIESGNDHACFVGDLFPTHHHLDPTWVMAYDLDPLTSIKQKKRYLERAIPERWLTLFPHDHATPAAFVELDEKGKPRAVQAGSRF